MFQTHDWLIDLAKKELSMEETGMVDFKSNEETESHLKEETYKYLNELYESFQSAAGVFNTARGQGLYNVKVYKIMNTRADFMLFRNHLKLVFSYATPGRIDITFSGYVSPYLKNSQEGKPAGATAKDTDRIEAFYGPFNEIIWGYNAQPVNKGHLVKYYMMEFVRHSLR